MDAIKTYDTHHERILARRRDRRRITIIIVSIIVIMVVVATFTVGVSDTKDTKSRSENKSSVSSSIEAACNVTLYPDTCYTTLAPTLKSRNVKPHELYKLSVQVALEELDKASRHFAGNVGKMFNITDEYTLATIGACQELFSLALDHLNRSAAVASDVKSLDLFRDLRTWLSSAGTYQQTCFDELANASAELVSFMNANFNQSQRCTSNGLAIVSYVAKSIDRVSGVGRRRRLMGVDDGSPEWLSVEDRRLLQEKGFGTKPDAVVAKDGSGNYETIGAALRAAPDKSAKRFVIYVKRGIYYENVRVEKTKWNVMMYGDGRTSTVVSGRLNVVDGTPTFQSATFAVFGQRFIGRDMGFRNTAGPEKHQAVALMSTADLSVFYRCNMDAYQDTLYPHSNRQFYRHCNVYGTVDFIFGNSASVFQHCNILPKKPMPGQQITVTAQGKFDPSQDTGLSFQNCTVQPAENLGGAKSFLGRPWKDYSTTIFFNSVIGSFIDPKGWLPWIGTTAPSTIFYAEFQNTGGGAGTTKRVTWKGLKLNLSAKQVKEFTAGPFINGDKWLPATGVPHKSGL